MEEALELIYSFQTEGLTYTNPVLIDDSGEEGPLFDVDVMQDGVFLTRKTVCVILDQKAVVMLPT